MKRLISVLIVLALLGLCACGEAVAPPEEETTIETTTQATTTTAPATAPAGSSVPLELTLEFITEDVEADFTFDFGPHPRFPDANLPAMLLRSSAPVRNMQWVGLTFGDHETFTLIYWPIQSFAPIHEFTPGQTLFIANYITVGSSQFSGFWLEDESGVRRLFTFALHTGYHYTGDPEADRFYTLREVTDTPVARHIHGE